MAFLRLDHILVVEELHPEYPIALVVLKTFQNASM